MKVLIIDDEEDTRSIASMSLSILGGVDVGEAEGGLEGIAKAEQDRPDVILLDMMMPVMDGIETLGELQKNSRTADIPVIFLTAKAMSTEIDRLIKLGAIAVLTKPFDPTTLATQVEQILQTRGLRVTPAGAPAASAPDVVQEQNQAQPAFQNSNGQQPQQYQPQQYMQHGQQSPQQQNQYQSQPQNYSQNNQGNHSQQNQQPQPPQPTVNQQHQQSSQPPYFQQQQAQYNLQPQNQGQPYQNGGAYAQAAQYAASNDQQRLAEQSVTSEYAVPTAQQSLQLRNTQQEMRLDPRQYNSGITPAVQPNGQQNQFNQQQGQQQGQQWIPQGPSQGGYDGQQPPLNYTEAPTLPPQNAYTSQSVPLTMHPGISGINVSPNVNPNLSDQRARQSTSSQMVPLPTKLANAEQIRQQQSITDAYPAPFSQSRPNIEFAQKSQGNNGAHQSAPKGSPSGPGKDVDVDPWVTAANVNAQSTSAKFILPKVAPTPTIKPVTAKAPVIKAPEGKPAEEPKKKRFTHPWGPYNAPNWSQDDDETTINGLDGVDGDVQEDDDDDENNE